MTDFIKLQTPEQAIRIGFTDQKVSGRAGLLTFAGFLHWHRLGDLLARVLPHQRVSKKAIPVNGSPISESGQMQKWISVSQLSVS